MRCRRDSATTRQLRTRPRPPGQPTKEAKNERKTPLPHRKPSCMQIIETVEGLCKKRRQFSDNSLVGVGRCPISPFVADRGVQFLNPFLLQGLYVCVHKRLNGG